MDHPQASLDELKAQISQLEDDSSTADREYNEKIQSVQDSINRRKSNFELALARFTQQLKVLKDQKNSGLQRLREALEVREEARPRNNHNEIDDISSFDLLIHESYSTFSDADASIKARYYEKDIASNTYNDFIHTENARMQRLEAESNEKKKQNDSRLAQLRIDLHNKEQNQRLKRVLQLREDHRRVEAETKRLEEEARRVEEETRRKKEEYRRVQEELTREVSLLDNSDSLDTLMTFDAPEISTDSPHPRVGPDVTSSVSHGSHQSDDAQDALRTVPCSDVHRESDPQVNNGDVEHMDHISPKNNPRDYSIMTTADKHPPNLKCSLPDNQTDTPSQQNPVLSHISGTSTGGITSGNITQGQNERSQTANQCATPAALRTAPTGSIQNHSSPSASHNLYRTPYDTVSHRIHENSTAIVETAQQVAALLSGFERSPKPVSVIADNERFSPVNAQDTCRSVQESSSNTVTRTTNLNTVDADTRCNSSADRFPSDSPLSSLDSEWERSPSRISTGTDHDTISLSPSLEKPEEKIFFKHNGVYYTAPPLMYRVPLRKLSEKDDYWEESWHNAKQYNSLAGRDDNKLAYFDEPGCTIHPNQLVAKKFLGPHGLVDRNYSDAIRRIIETLQRSGRTFEQALYWLRYRLAQLHEEKGSTFALRTTLKHMRTQDKKYMAILEAYPNSLSKIRTSSHKAKVALSQTSAKESKKRQFTPEPTVVQFIPDAPPVPSKKPRLSLEFDIYDVPPDHHSRLSVHKSRNWAQRQSSQRLSPEPEQLDSIVCSPTTAQSSAVQSSFSVSKSPVDDTPRTSAIPATVPDKCDKVPQETERVAPVATESSPKTQPNPKPHDDRESCQRGTQIPQQLSPYVGFKNIERLGKYKGENGKYQLRLDRQTKIFEPFRNDAPLSALNPELVIDPKRITKLSFSSLFNQGDTIVISQMYAIKDRERLKKSSSVEVSFKETSDADRLAGYIMSMRPKVGFENEADHQRIWLWLQNHLSKQWKSR